MHEFLYKGFLKILFRFTRIPLNRYEHQEKSIDLYEEELENKPRTQTSITCYGKHYYLKERSMSRLTKKRKKRSRDSSGPRFLS